MIEKWLHLKGISVPAIDGDQVTLLIGRDVQEVLWAFEERRGGRKVP